jgi:hypothetical protein
MSLPEYPHLCKAHHSFHQFFLVFVCFFHGTPFFCAERGKKILGPFFRRSKQQLQIRSKECFFRLFWTVSGKKKANRGPHPTPTGLRPQHPERGGTKGGNAQQHETQAAARGQTEINARTPKRTHTSSQAPRRPPQKLQPREQRRQ